MLNVLAQGDELHRLERLDGTVVGWIRDRTIGLHGSGDEHRAMTVAAAAWRALDTALRRQYPGWPRYEPVVDRLRILHDGRHEWIADDTRKLARLLRVDDAPPGMESFAVEFDLPSYATLGTLVSAAQSMSRALAEGAVAGPSPDARPDA
ncbi:hypothetical protein J421_5021 (plasmid) [Gemmatirosa kalamazoonensis]|uniref:Uncharacterized protein n=1 Tax=Gemmatirosa kalamazoonensis TaxID=861299 RepID=W0RP93_9BACT|nr:hypothetical protein [Gemmatirosa kalamazoonensis]AHG92556.1 hypothetical protein J421_5021 [Gemmatirosa kalamazoonensis]